MAKPTQLSAAFQSDNLYQLLVDGVSDYALYMLDPTGRIASWNSGAQRFKGYMADEIIGENFSRFYTEEDRAAGLPAQALKIAATEGRYEKEGWRVRKDGARFWAHVVIDPIRSPAGDLIGYAKITRDLTERKLREESLQQSEAQFRLLVKGVTDYAIYMLDPDGVVSSWNLGAERIKGYAPDEIVGQHFSRFYSEEDRANGIPQRGLETARRNGRYETEGWRVRKDGSRFWAHVVVDAISDDDGVVIGFAKITRDMTERQAAQRALEEAREALFQAQKMEAIGQLTGGVAHDFNNLLMAILGSLELVQKRLPDDPVASRLINNAIMGAQRGASLTQRMLAFARRQDLKLEPVDAAALVRGMADLLERSLGPPINVDIRFARDLPAVQSDPAQLESAILNLALNARDAMPDGGLITITGVAVTVGDGETLGLERGDYLRLSVSDTGEGMDEATLARATEPFFTSKGVGKGTGLGLSMVHGVVQQSGGALRLSSQPGEGTQIDMFLPLAASGAWAPAAVAGKALAGEAGPFRVLVVDDDSLVLMNSAAMLEDLGHTVSQAPSAAKALAVLRADPAIDLIVTDQAMPGMTGLQLAEIVRTERPHIPIILATGYAELPAGVDIAMTRLAKPFALADLAAAIAVARPKI